LRATSGIAKVSNGQLASIQLGNAEAEPRGRTGKQVICGKQDPKVVPIEVKQPKTQTLLEWNPMIDVLFE